MQIVSTYPDKDTILAYPALIGQAYIAVNQGEDFLGHVAAEIGALDVRAGQFFTPLHVCQLMAEIGLVGAGSFIRDQGFITLNEPTAGAGAMVVAAADVLERQGFDPAFHMIVKAQDISQLCFHNNSLLRASLPWLSVQTRSLWKFSSRHGRLHCGLFSRSIKTHRHRWFFIKVRFLGRDADSLCETLFFSSLGAFRQDLRFAHAEREQGRIPNIFSLILFEKITGDTPLPCSDLDRTRRLLSRFTAHREICATMILRRKGNEQNRCI
ncbi:MAG TPA: hypothetical protein PLE43_09750 [Alphaproteobacteria bacterium]|nr:hypothetical protein [Alphaproteobacteria bacterium]